VGALLSPLFIRIFLLCTILLFAVFRDNSNACAHRGSD